MKSLKALPLAAMALALACTEGSAPTSPGGRDTSGPSLLNTPINGASFTTVNEDVDGAGHCKNGNPNVNCNQYDGKQYVWMNGGPVAAQIGPDGDYFFAVLEPGGQGGNENPNDGTLHNLSDVSPTSGTGAGDPWTDRVFTITGGVITYGGPHDFDVANQKIRLIPYDNTTNPGGVYIMAICSLADRDQSAANAPGVDPSDCKYDAFKVREGECPDCGEEGNPQLQLFKYFDTNENGQWDSGEPGIGDWRIAVTSGGSPIAGSPVHTLTSGPDVGKAFLTVAPGTYHLAELQASSFVIGGGPAIGLWTQTGNTVSQYFDFLNTTTLTNKQYDVIAVQDGFTTGLNFGNVCKVRPGGRTMGFWSNKNGLALITSGDFTALTGFNLRNANGSARDFTGSLSANKTAYNNWLLSANATNMAYMLSAQMSATYLDVVHGFTDGTFVVDGSRTINEEIAYANSLLANPIVGGPFNGQNGSVTSAAGALRTEQERVKNIFDKINNNGSLGDFLQGPDFCLAHVSFP